MKNQSLSILAIAVTGIAITFTACKKQDTVIPEIVLTGDSLSLDLGATYTDPGYTATDDQDGDIKSSVAVTNEPNTALVNRYEVTYNVSDAAGNAAAAKMRIVKVKSDLLAGSYDVDDSVSSGPNAGGYTETITVTQSSTLYNKILMGNFAGAGASVSVYATVTGSVITIPAQTPSGLGVSGSVTGTGTYSGSTKSILTLDYTIDYGSGVKDVGHAIFTKN